VIINAALITLVAFLIWYFGFWAAGDSKLFIMFSFFVLLKVNPFQKILPLYPIIVFLTNVFVLLFIFLLAVFFTKVVVFIKNKVLQSGSCSFYDVFLFSLKNIFKYIKKRIFKCLRFVLSYLTFIMLIQLVVRNMNFPQLKLDSSLSMLSYLMPLLLYRTFNKILLKHVSILVFSSFLMICLLVNSFIIFGSSAILSFIAYLKNFTYFFVLFYSLRKLLSLRNDIIEEVPVANLPDRSQLTDESILKFGFKKIGKLYPDGLTQDQINEVRTDLLRNRSSETIEIYKTLPLAPFIFLGAFITVLVKFPIINLLIFGKISQTYF
jgi:hypothetical protein